MNLQKLNVQEMQAEELMETSGGTETPSLWDTYVDVMTDSSSWNWLYYANPYYHLAGAFD